MYWKDNFVNAVIDLVLFPPQCTFDLYIFYRGAWLTGFMPGESIGLSAYALLHPDDIGGVVAMHNSCEFPLVTWLITIISILKFGLQSDCVQVLLPILCFWCILDFMLTCSSHSQQF